MRFLKNNATKIDQREFRSNSFTLILKISFIVFSCLQQGCQSRKDLSHRDITEKFRQELKASEPHYKGVDNFQNSIFEIKPLSEEISKFSVNKNLKIFRLYYFPPFEPEMIFTIYLTSERSWIETRYTNVVINSVFFDYHMDRDWKAEAEKVNLYIETCPIDYISFNEDIKEIDVFSFPNYMEVGQRPFITDGDLYYHFSIKENKFHHFKFYEPQKGLSKYDDLFLELVGLYLKARKCR